MADRADPHRRGLRIPPESPEPSETPASSSCRLSRTLGSDALEFPWLRAHFLERNGSRISVPTV
jgi:hypothetical protein